MQPAAYNLSFMKLVIRVEGCFCKLVFWSTQGDVIVITIANGAVGPVNQIPKLIERLLLDERNPGQLGARGAAVPASC